MLIREIIAYDPITGKFTWLVHTPGRTRGKEAKGTVANNGYIHIRVDRRIYLAHRLAWYLSYGMWPNTIDHINRIKTDNRLSNLRDVPLWENVANRGR
jgi:hypothetical protein